MTSALSTAPDIAIDVAGLSKSFGGREVVHDLSMQVKRGTIYGFLGPNGSGKTTTIRMLCGLLTPDAGEGRCLGYDIRREADKIKRQVGYMTQRFSLYQDLSVRENLEFVARLYGIDLPPLALAGSAAAGILIGATTPGVPSAGLMLQAPLYAVKRWLRCQRDSKEDAHAMADVEGIAATADNDGGKPGCALVLNEAVASLSGQGASVSVVRSAVRNGAL